jgi:molybdopterin converting factor small subunit
MLREVAGATTLRLRAGTVAEALEEAYRLVPQLRFALCDDDGTFRPHVLCFHNDVNTRDLKSLDVALREGDRISILQAVSGG